mmetsp:Transcript_31770/g.69501  ORF Transcript_31770/g.69501 Transcript_31770/m.69501 type:complete len:255 (+) Transcript_31770:1195-1959(+)
MARVLLLPCGAPLEPGGDQSGREGPPRRKRDGRARVFGDEATHRLHGQDAASLHKREYVAALLLIRRVFRRRTDNHQRRRALFSRVPRSLNPALRRAGLHLWRDESLREIARRSHLGLARRRLRVRSARQDRVPAGDPRPRRLLLRRPRPDHEFDPRRLHSRLDDRGPLRRLALCFLRLCADGRGRMLRTRAARQSECGRRHLRHCRRRRQSRLGPARFPLLFVKRQPDRRAVRQTWVRDRGELNPLHVSLFSE